MAKAGYNHVLLEIFKIPRILGWFPFDRKFRLSEKSISYCFFVAFIVPLIHRSLRLSFLEQSYHPVKISFNRLSMVCNVCSYVFPIFWWIRRRRTAYNFMKTINKLINKCPNVRFKRNQLRCINLLLTPPILFSCYACKFCEVWYNASRYFFSNISFYYGVSFICQFLEVLHVLQYILRHENKLEDGDKAAISKCFLTLLQVDQAVYNPSLFLLTTQYLIQIISYLFMALIMHPHSSEFFKKKLVFDLLHNIIPLVTMICSYALVKAQVCFSLEYVWYVLDHM